MFLGACQVEGRFHNPFATFGCCSGAVTEFADGVDAVAVVGMADGRDVTPLKVVAVAFSDDGGKLEGNLCGAVGSVGCWVSCGLVSRCGVFDNYCTYLQDYVEDGPD